jgi:hypothetical protein
MMLYLSDRTKRHPGRFGLFLVVALFAFSWPLAADDSTAAAAKAAPTMERGDEEVLRERAAAYWQARQSRSRQVMDFYAPADKGGPTRPKDVSEFGNVGYSSYAIEDVTVDGGTGIVQIAVTAVFPLPLPKKVAKDIMSRKIGEEWLKVDGVWYKKPIPAGFATNKTRPKAPPEIDPDAVDDGSDS